MPRTSKREGFMRATGGFCLSHERWAARAVRGLSDTELAEALAHEIGIFGGSCGPGSLWLTYQGACLRTALGNACVRIGIRKLLPTLTVAVLHDTVGVVEEHGPLYAAIDGELAAIIAVADPVKESSAEAIGALHALGLKVAMITGDNRRTADAVARLLGIDEVVAEVLPAGKVAAIKALRGGNRQIAFVGDGINDAPALAEADVGLAVGTGTDIAIESADVVLMSGDLRGVANAIALSRRTIGNIKQHLFWAFAYNVMLIPLAAGVLYPINGMLLSPVIAAGAMALERLRAGQCS